MRSTSYSMDDPITVVPKRPMTEERKKVFLQELTKHGILHLAAKAASPHCKGGNVVGWRDLRKRDPEFNAECYAAIEIANAEMERELHRRAVEGYTEEVRVEKLDGDGKVTSVEIREAHKFSDQLLLAILKARNPAYRDRNQVEHVGAVGIADISRLPKESREDFRKILQREIDEGADDE